MNNQVNNIANFSAEQLVGQDLLCDIEERPSFVSQTQSQPLPQLGSHDSDLSMDSGISIASSVEELEDLHQASRTYDNILGNLIYSGILGKYSPRGSTVTNDETPPLPSPLPDQPGNWARDACGLNEASLANLLLNNQDFDVFQWYEQNIEESLLIELQALVNKMESYGVSAGLLEQTLGMGMGSDSCHNPQLQQQAPSEVGHYASKIAESFFSLERGKNGSPTSSLDFSAANGKGYDEKIAACENGNDRQKEQVKSALDELYMSKGMLKSKPIISKKVDNEKPSLRANAPSFNPNAPSFTPGQLASPVTPKQEELDLPDFIKQAVSKPVQTPLSLRIHRPPPFDERQKGCMQSYYTYEEDDNAVFQEWNYENVVNSSFNCNKYQAKFIKGAKELAPNKIPSQKQPYNQSLGVGGNYVGFRSNNSTDFSKSMW
eukprot:TRINITY_DN80582_c0_g1_i1.p1 TRINITY_DN80582_c0_g1~~TRINITY_DN80582_c0_g1_i1.p1  ORF type:complete len:433 (-),score=45.61 TRINITY_DN80582_c0_g1_i1:897-2195(-)